MRRAPLLEKVTETGPPPTSSWRIIPAPFPARPLPAFSDFAVTKGVRISSPGQSRHDYLLATGEQAAPRLQLLNDIFGPATRELLKSAGISPGMNAVDIGCGSGLNSLWMAEVVGSRGHVTAADASPEQLRVAEQNAAQRGLKNISFVVADVYDTHLPRASFDLVYSRFLTCHLTQPCKALDEMRQLLRPGGIFVCEDFDSDGLSTDPPTPAYERLRSMVEITHRARGADSRIGMKLPRLILESGFPAPEVRITQPAYFRGREKLFWELSLLEAAPGVLAAGVATPDEIDSLCEEMRRIANDESILLVFPRFFQVWARKP